MSWIAQNKLLVIIIALVVAGGVWYGLSQSGEPEPLLSTTAADGTSITQSTDQEIIGTLLALRAVTLSGSIFTDPSFLTLQDFGTPIVAEPVGRENPFAPLGSRPAGTTSTSGQSSSTR